MNADVVVNLIVTGIIAIVPSAKDPNLTRLIAPAAHSISGHTSHGSTAVSKNVADCRKQLDACRQDPSISPHFAYIEVDAKNVVAGERREDFRYRVAADDSERLIFVLRSEKVEFANAHTNTTLVRATAKPADLKKPQTEAEKLSSAYILDMTRVCPECRTIDEAYFDILEHPEASAMRMDFRGGTESTHGLRPAIIWTADKTGIDQPLAEEVRYQFAVPACGQRLILSRKLAGAANVQTSFINLISPDGEPIDIKLGNAPLHTAVPTITRDFLEAGGDHFGLFYRIYEGSPAARPRLVAKDGTGNVVGHRVPCLVTRAVAQDPQ